VEWTQPKWRASYRLSLSRQDNRQIGRENADLNFLSNAFGFGLSPNPHWNVGADLNLERGENKEQDRVDLTRRIGFNITFLPVPEFSIGAIFNTGKMHDERDITENNNLGLNLEASYRFKIMDRSQGQAFVRYSRQTSDSSDTTFGFNQNLETWTVNTGLALSFF
jgi:hypothetical protein